MQRQGHSDTDLVAAVRRAASEASSVPLGRSRHGRSEADLHARVPSSRHSSGSRSSGRYAVKGFTLEEQQRHVQEAAMQRYIVQLEKDAREAVKDRSHWDRSVHGGLDEEKNEARRRRELEEQNQQKVREQIEANKVRRAESRKEFIEAASLHSFPLFTETYIDEEEVEAYRKNQKQQWREELERQMVTNATLRNLQLKQYKDQAVQRHAENLSNVQRERGLERERLASQGREMVSSWDRDIKLKSLKKAIFKGDNVVQDTMRQATAGRSRGYS